MYLANCCSDYVRTPSCKRRWLSKYFDDIETTPCFISEYSKCSSCVARVSPDPSVSTMIATGRVPCDPMTATREKIGLSFTRIPEDQAYALLRLFNTFLQTGYCSLCYIFANQTKRQHELGHCPLMCSSGGTFDVKCFRCAGAHKSRQCPVPHRFEDGTFCFICCCVYKVGSVQLHMPGPCTHGAKDRLFISCWFAKRHLETLTSEVKEKYSVPLAYTDDGFFHWLLTKDEGNLLQNNLKLFGDLMNWNWRMGGY
jgi:hypothetical protein